MDKILMRMYIFDKKITHICTNKFIGGSILAICHKRNLLRLYGKQMLLQQPDPPSQEFLNHKNVALYRPLPLHQTAPYRIVNFTEPHPTEAYRAILYHTVSQCSMPWPPVPL